MATHPPAFPARAWLPYAVLAGGIMIAASAAIMIRSAQDLGAPSLLIAAGRLCIAALILAPIGLWRARADVRAADVRDINLALLSGVFLALHFAAWIASFAYTSVASSVALVATNPLWVAIASVVLFRERLTRMVVVGIVLTALGSVAIGLSSGGGNTATAGRTTLLGNGLALLGAIAGSGYFLIGRGLRRRMPVLPYIWLSYTSAALVLLMAALVLVPDVIGTTLALPPLVWALLIGLAIGPQLLGHTAFNWSLGKLSATFVAIALLGEPIGSALLALIFFQEGFTLQQFVGFVLLLAGIVVASLGEGTK